jgi:hypothetical protein
MTTMESEGMSDEQKIDAVLYYCVLALACAWAAMQLH